MTLPHLLLITTLGGAAGAAEALDCEPVPHFNPTHI